MIVTVTLVASAARGRADAGPDASAGPNTHVSAPAPAPAKRAEIEARLQKAPLGLSPAELSGLGADAGGWLVRIADDRAAPTPIRARALASLAYVRTPAAHNFLENFVIRKQPSSDPIDRTLLRKAAVALGWQSGPRCVEVLAILLDHPDAEVRLDAVVALGLSRASAAERPLRDRLALEGTPAVRAQIENQLKIIAAASDRARDNDRPAR